VAKWREIARGRVALEERLRAVAANFAITTTRSRRGAIGDPKRRRGTIEQTPLAPPLDSVPPTYARNAH